MNTVPASLRRYRADLVAAVDRELERAAPVRQRPGLRPARWRMLLVGVAVVAIVLLAFTVAAPWRGSVSILDRAEAALLAPSAGQVLYERVTVRPIVFSARGTVGRVQLWLDGARPHRFRMTFGGAWQAELGGTLGTSTGLSYVASDQALRRAGFLFRVRELDLDPAAFIRVALESGRAKLDGTARIRGRDVVRIQVSAWFSTPTSRFEAPIALYYVDAHTYRPVRVVVPPPNGRVVLLTGTDQFDPVDYDHLVFYPDDKNTSALLGLLMDPSAFLSGSPGYSMPTLPVIPGPGMKFSGPRLHRIYDFEEYRLLAPTARNRKLTSIRAMHSGASATAKAG